MNQEVAGLLLALIAIGGLTALKAFSKGPPIAHKTKPKTKCTGRSNTMLLPVENLHS